MQYDKRGRFGGIELREDANSESPRIAGIAAVFYRAGEAGTEYELWPEYGTRKRAVERIMPGAFDDAVGRDDVIARFNHDQNLVLGRTSAGTLSLKVTERGLDYETTPANTTIYRDTTEWIRRGEVQGSSFAFFVDKADETWRMEDKQEVREIHNLTLVDVSPVTDPAYTSTTSEARNRWESQHVAEQRRRVTLAASARGRILELLTLGKY